ncbi:hypothetical protein [Brumimicrobium oceani]|uniref:Uncharacterized protein n=1 Tax=Brumimicrobium oceani TaxID=2100725 RepID=A0A2U2XEF0_9FLAO|nr:hypothetical protein [Brumimicrobium oceani]PWH86186.1 hypothetical protein DIT68_06425 [Brumimicrobium oceani]
MDTDDLSIPTYDGILGEAEKFNHDLTLQFGLLASQCKDDDEYLNNAENLIKSLLEVKEFDYIIEEVFFGNYVSKTELHKALNKILKNIAEIRKTPMDKREYEDWG